MIQNKITKTDTITFWFETSAIRYLSLRPLLIIRYSGGSCIYSNQLPPPLLGKKDLRPVYKATWNPVTLNISNYRPNRALSSPVDTKVTLQSRQLQGKLQSFIMNEVPQNIVITQKPYTCRVITMKVFDKLPGLVGTPFTQRGYRETDFEFRAKKSFQRLLLPDWLIDLVG